MADGALAVLYSLGATLVWQVGAWGIPRRDSWRGRVALGADVLAVVALIVLAVVGTLPLPSVAVFTQEVPTWKPLLVGLAFGLAGGFMVRPWIQRRIRTLRHSSDRATVPLTLKEARREIEGLEEREFQLLMQLWTGEGYLDFVQAEKWTKEHGKPLWHLAVENLKPFAVPRGNAALTLTEHGKAVMLALTREYARQQAEERRNRERRDAAAGEAVGDLTNPPPAAEHHHEE